MSKILISEVPTPLQFEERSQEETERQERCARSKAWNLSKNMYKLKEKDNATFYSLTDKWIMPAASTIKPEEREFVVDCGASMHMVSKKDLNSAELQTMGISTSSTTVMTANGEVQTREEATVYVKELNFFVTVKLLEEITGRSFTRKTLRRSRIFLRVDQWSETTTHPKRQEI